MTQNSNSQNLTPLAVLVDSPEEFVTLMVGSGIFKENNIKLFYKGVKCKNVKQISKFLKPNLLAVSDISTTVLAGVLWNPKILNGSIKLKDVIKENWFSILEEIVKLYPLNENHFKVIDMHIYYNLTNVGNLLAKRPHNLTAEAQEHLFINYQFDVWGFLAARDDLTSDVMKKMVYSSADWVRKIVALKKNGTLPYTLVRKLANDEAPEVRASVASNSFPLTYKTWVRLAKDQTLTVRAAVAKNGACPEEVRVLAGLNIT